MEFVLPVFPVCKGTLTQAWHCADITVLCCQHICKTPPPISVSALLAAVGKVWVGGTMQTVGTGGNG